MEIKRLISHFTYRIEAKPEGGFIAHASDPSVPPLEAPTREELQQKIQANIGAALAAEFPALKLPMQGNKASFAFHIEHKPGGGFILQSTDGKELPIVGNTHAEIENHFAEKIVGLLGNHHMPELSQALAGQPGNGDVQVLVNYKSGFSSLQQSSTFGAVGQIQPSIQAGCTTNQNALNSSSSSLLTPEASGVWPIIRFLLAVLIVGAVIYFLRHR